jgi:Protein of unknown function (DUF2568)
MMGDRYRGPRPSGDRASRARPAASGAARAGRARPGPRAARLANAALRVVMELGVVGAFAVWGARIGDGAVWSVVAGIVAPAVGFGFWGAVDFHQAGRWAEPLRLLQELVITGLAAVSLAAVGLPALAWAMAVVSVVHHALVYALGTRLIKPR